MLINIEIYHLRKNFKINYWEQDFLLSKNHCIRQVNYWETKLQTHELIQVVMILRNKNLLNKELFHHKKEKKFETN